MCHCQQYFHIGTNFDVHKLTKMFSEVEAEGFKVDELRIHSFPYQIIFKEITRFVSLRHPKHIKHGLKIGFIWGAKVIIDDTLPMNYLQLTGQPNE